MRIVLTGASGQLGGYLLREFQAQGRPVTAWSGNRTGELFGQRLHPVDLAMPDRVAAAYANARPEVVLHLGAVTTVAECFREPERARRVNTGATAVLAELAGRTGARLILVSTDMVFDGTRGGYREEDLPAPLSVYGRTKAEAEQVVLAVARGVVVRTSLLYGPSVVGRPGFFDNQVSDLRRGRPFPLFEDEWRTPLDLLTAARALLALAGSDYRGLLHLGGPERLSRLEMGRLLAAHLGCDPGVIIPSRRDDLKAPEPRPHDVSLDSSRWRGLVPSLPWPSGAEALRQIMSG
jgi:dTDP-4-dehydrorhamnose reductase